MKCIITGCAMQLEGHPGMWLAGDLFEVGDCYVFNGNQDRDASQPRWMMGNSPHYRKRVELLASLGGAFENKGVFVAPKDDWRLNAEAAAYIGVPA